MAVVIYFGMCILSGWIISKIYILIMRFIGWLIFGEDII